MVSWLWDDQLFVVHFWYLISFHDFYVTHASKCVTQASKMWNGQKSDHGMVGIANNVTKRSQDLKIEKKNGV